MLDGGIHHASLNIIREYPDDIPPENSHVNHYKSNLSEIEMNIQSDNIKGDIAKIYFL